MFEKILVWWKELNQEKRKLVIGIALGAVFVILLGVAIIGITDNEPGPNDFDTIYLESTGGKDTEETESIATELETESESEIESESKSESQSQVVEKEDPQSSVGGNMTNQEGASVDISQVVEQTPSNETREVTLGIDVARYQGTIDWKKVAESGVDFAMIRVGYRELVTGKIVADSNAKYNMQEATKYGIQIGAYFFSTAITKEEAIEEANWVANYIAKYQITYPVVYNCEGYEDSENRQYSLSKTQRTDFAIAFLNKIAERGYTPMFYASKSEMEGDAKWETSRLQGKYKIWVAQYPSTPYPQTAQSSYSGKHDMWQYTNKGTVPGISKPVDMNVAYFGFKETQGPQDSEKPEDVEADVEAGMKFKDVNETVTAKDRTNLRDKPSQGSDATVVYTLTNGETATRTGISDSGWSRIEFKGQTLYAVTSYLTTDLSIKQPEVEAPDEPTYEEQNGIKTQFKDADDWLTPKDEINLRTKPTTDNSVGPVVVTLHKGDLVHRIGINEEVGWSKVMFNNQILYCVTSYMEVVESPTETEVSEE